ncbi:hypothetical protein GX51_03563 [Blastomyces parvus]|uniref:Uncharacterized protein n=1 Tax=Blastomyces parvus TaxID=2060905 RepID=A0A2B7WYI0_9EURO|nr:hypothetical protein GX51_03563 [Blastomyces parvus]
MESPARLSIHRTPTQKQLKMIGPAAGSYQDGPCLETSDYSSHRSRRHRRRQADPDISLSEGLRAKFWLFHCSLTSIFQSDWSGQWVFRTMAVNTDRFEEARHVNGHPYPHPLEVAIPLEREIGKGLPPKHRISESEGARKRKAESQKGTLHRPDGKATTEKQSISLDFGLAKISTGQIYSAFGVLGEKFGI